ncbi:MULTISPECIES: hypothetical protein [unclassified Paenibacillus]|nr:MULTISPECIES: hypothetical protein [unclassified Paenibacillus]
MDQYLGKQITHFLIPTTAAFNLPTAGDGTLPAFISGIPRKLVPPSSYL